MPAGTVVLNDWGEGGYLMWAYPDLDFVVSGYGDIYTDSEIARNYRLDGTAPRLGRGREKHRPCVRARPTRVEARLRAADVGGLEGHPSQRGSGPPRAADVLRRLTWSRTWPSRAVRG